MAVARQRRARSDQDAGPSSLAIHNVVVGGHRTSVRLEPVMWEALQEIAQAQRVSVHRLVTDIDRDRSASTLTAAIRVYIVNFYRAAALVGGRPQPSRPRHRAI